ncbi:MAG: tetratricopeptide repeat protein [Gammaproteobacteria bacterium]
MVIKFFIAIVFTLIAGCAGISKEQKESLQEPAPEIVETPQAEAGKAAPEKSIDPKVLYLLLSAELAGQRGLYDIALEGYLQAARIVDDPSIAERATKIALFRKDYRSAEEAGAIWLKNDSENPVARKVSAILALRNGDKTAALENLDFVLKADPAGFEGNLIDIFKSLDGQGKESMIFEVLDSLALRNSEQASIPFLQALIAMQLDRKEVALEKINKALELQPGWNKAVMFQAQVAANSGDLDKAEIILRDAVESKPESTKLKILLAQILIKSQKFEEAASVYREIVKLNPDDDESSYSLALIHIQLQQDKKARRLLLKLMDNRNFEDQASLQMGRIEARAGNNKEALVWFDKVASGPFAFEASISAIGLLIDQKEYEQAADRLNGLPADSPEQEMRLILLQADLLNQQKRYSEAFDLMTEALDNMPEQKEFLYARALISEHLDRLDILENDLKTILQTNPDDASVLNALGYTLADRTDRLDEAEGYLLRALEIQPDEAVILDSYGWLLFRQGKVGMALNYLKRAYKKEKVAEIAGHLVEALWQKGKKEEARKVFAKALRKDPEDEYLLRLKREIDGLASD